MNRLNLGNETFMVVVTMAVCIGMVVRSTSVATATLVYIDTCVEIDVTYVQRERGAKSECTLQCHR
jgi:hypothetical protein